MASVGFWFVLLFIMLWILSLIFVSERSSSYVSISAPHPSSFIVLTISSNSCLLFKLLLVSTYGVLSGSSQTQSIFSVIELERMKFLDDVTTTLTNRKRVALESTSLFCGPTSVFNCVRVCNMLKLGCYQNH
ncbi:hypothetical protein R6Q59_016013 [Mikania micrantha]